MRATFTNLYLAPQVRDFSTLERGHQSIFSRRADWSMSHIRVRLGDKGRDKILLWRRGRSGYHRITDGEAQAGGNGVMISMGIVSRCLLVTASLSFVVGIAHALKSRPCTTSSHRAQHGGNDSRHSQVGQYADSRSSRLHLILILASI